MDRRLLFLFVLELSAVGSAWAAPCSPDMVSYVALQPRWNTGSGPGRGLDVLFDKETHNAQLCNGCHGSTSGMKVSQPMCWQCHDQGIDWLRLDSPAYMKRNSYYLPGKSKAEASIARVKDGTMPPIALHPGWTSLGIKQGNPLCDEFMTVFQQWVNLGYPEN